jgi:hypothetical protein
MAEDRVIGTARKNAHSVFQVSLSHHEGRVYVSVQTCHQPEGTGDKPRPMNLGFYSRPAAARELGRLLIEAADQACLEVSETGRDVEGAESGLWGNGPRPVRGKGGRIRGGWSDC